ncbi:L,D-transpeptidase family protein [Halopseudomonas salegens]|uniref:Murein L,D-transpeptidase YcbB/YkuD n=1 Tax=Halopseudomonas salegens TaxID=1434072 RepID=A0A1H2F4B4_9GAMM|nr:L,D-transpeptidase family protein [Halopseudomonas salegens]SDU02236.1 Murein L,D-transpeptidase YcbB/YkuD [Halopseudomonas salegens]
MFIKCTQQFVALSLGLLLSSTLLADDLPLLITAELDPDLTPLCPTDAHSNPAALHLLYSHAGFRPLWQNPEQRSALTHAVQTLQDDGLDPERYRATWQSNTVDKDSLYRRLCDDILISSRYLLALEHLLLGSLPADVQEGYWQHETGARPVFTQWLADHIALLPEPTAAINAARPDSPHYQQLRMAYRQLRDHRPDWDTLDTGPNLRPESSSERIPPLRQRLSHLDLITAATDPERPEHYDSGLETAVRSMQSRYGLTVDGIVGAATIEALNVSREDRLQQLRINLERQRWLEHFFQPDQLVVNIAGGDIRLYKKGERQWEARAQTGRLSRRTPLLVSTLNRVTLNPSWTIPPTILREDKLPGIRNDPDFLAREHLRVLDFQGRQLDPAEVDWQHPQGIMLRQDPGPLNPLGRMAFRFPNPFHVYLHDTPSQHIFQLSNRSVSSGCVRVQRAAELAEAVFATLPAERRTQIEQQLASGRTREINLPTGIQLILAYWTAEVEDGQLRFLPDPYNMDPALISALH